MTSEPEPSVAQEPLRYRLLTGAGDRAFCERISEALDEGYSLHGSPVIAIGPGGEIVAAQAVIR